MKRVAVVLSRGLCGTLKRVMWYLKRVMWYFEAGFVVLYRG